MVKVLQQASHTKLNNIHDNTIGKLICRKINQIQQSKVIKIVSMSSRLSILALLVLLSALSVNRTTLCAKIQLGRSRSMDLNYMDAKDVTWPIIERYYLIVKYFEPVCGYEDTEIAKPICWSDKASYYQKFNHTRQLANSIGFCNGTKIPLPEIIYKGLEGNKVINSPVSHLNAMALIDGVASVHLIKNFDNKQQMGPKMKYDAKLILDDLLYKTASEASIEFFYNYKSTYGGYHLHKPKFMDLITRMNVYLSTNVNDRTSFLELPTRLSNEMQSEARLLRSYFNDPNHDLTLFDMLKAFGLGESDFASLTKTIYLESCTHESDRQIITMDFVHRSMQKFSYLLPSDPHSQAAHNDRTMNSKSSLLAEIQAAQESDNNQESFIELAKRRVLDTIGVIYD